MLKQGSVGQLRSGELTRQHGYIVLAMAFYPRGLKKELADEYRSHLAPDRQLFRDWKDFAQKFGHEAAFEKARYDKRFTLPPRCLGISKAANRCKPNQRCLFDLPM